MPALQTPPRRPLPPGAWDCHTHVFGPYARFALSENRSYTPPEATIEDYLGMLDRVGLAHGVLVQPSAYGFNHDALLDALSRQPGRLRGTGVWDRTVTDAELERLHAGGVRALRFVDTGGPGGTRFAGAVGVEELPSLAPRLKALGWHVECWITCDQFIADVPSLLATGLTFVLDHMARFDATRGLSDPTFQSLLSLVKEGRVWVKMTPARNSKQFPDYADVRPFHDALVKANPDVLVWGSDWPYLRMNEATPDAGHLLDLLGDWAGEETLRRKILADNPARLYAA